MKIYWNQSELRYIIKDNEEFSFKCAMEVEYRV
jgi:hypothetical protein